MLSSGYMVIQATCANHLQWCEPVTLWLPGPQPHPFLCLKALPQLLFILRCSAIKLPYLPSFKSVAVIIWMSFLSLTDKHAQVASPSAWKKQTTNQPKIFWPATYSTVSPNSAKWALQSPIVERPLGTLVLPLLWPLCEFTLISSSPEACPSSELNFLLEHLPGYFSTALAASPPTLHISTSPPCSQPTAYWLSLNSMSKICL